jgi:hypothetical protein
MEKTYIFFMKILTGTFRIIFVGQISVSMHPEPVFLNVVGAQK